MINLEQLAWFNQQLAAMLREGLPLGGALRQLTAAQQAGGLASGAGSLAGSASGAAQGSGSGSSSFAGNQLAAAASAASQAQGAFAVTKGTPVFGPDGDKIGKVRQVFSNAGGQVEQLLVKVDGEKAMLPASNFTASGSGVVSAMSEAEITQVAEQQEAAEDAES